MIYYNLRKVESVYTDKNNVICFSKVFIMENIYELMRESLQYRNKFWTKKKKSSNESEKDFTLFRPNDLYRKLSEHFIEKYDKVPNKNTFHLAAGYLENERKIKRIKIKTKMYYKLL